jgi:hypothetical protein
MRFIIIFISYFSFNCMLWAQSTAFVLNGGGSMGIQRWDDGFGNQPLFRYHAAVALESINNEDDRSSILAQIGYHTRGSAIRFNLVDFNGNFTGFSRDAFVFNNLALMIGLKQRKPLGGGNARIFYFGGLRGEYSLSNNLDELAGNNQFAALVFPQSAFVNKFLGGVSAGGGLEFPFGDLVGGQLTFSINPDFLNQYNQPEIRNVIIPGQVGGNTTIPERRIRNLTFELSVGLRLLRKVVYTN